MTNQTGRIAYFALDVGIISEREAVRLEHVHDQVSINTRVELGRIVGSILSTQQRWRPHRPRFLYWVIETITTVGPPLQLSAGVAVPSPKSIRAVRQQYL